MTKIFSLRVLFLLMFSLGFKYMNCQEPLPTENIKKLPALKKVVFFNPTIDPKVEEIYETTFLSYFSAVSNQTLSFNDSKMIRVEAPLEYEDVNPNFIEEICANNDADYATVSKIKFFKVGIGKYVFSSQVVVSMKLFDACGQLLTETQYDTYKKNARILGSAENSIKIGTKGAYKNIVKNLRKLRHSNPKK